MQSNAYVAANRFTEILFNLVAGGALASAFIPTFTTLLTHEDRPGAWRLASAVTNWVFLIATLFSHSFVHFCTLDRAHDPGTGLHRRCPV